MRRKHHLFCWCELGTEQLGILQSLGVTYWLHDFNPYNYLVDVLQRVSRHHTRDVASSIMAGRASTISHAFVRRDFKIQINDNWLIDNVTGHIRIGELSWNQKRLTLFIPLDFSGPDYATGLNVH